MKRFALAGLLALLFISDADAQVFRRRAVVVTSPGVGVSSNNYSGYYSPNYGYSSGTVIQAGFGLPSAGYSNYGNSNYGNSNYGYSNYGYSNYGRYNNNSYSPYGGGYRGYNSSRYGNYYGGRRGW